MGALRSWREPAVIVLLVVVGLRELLVVGFGLAALAGAADPYGQASYQAAADATEPVALVLVTVLLATCHAAPVTPRARSLTTLGLVVLVVAVVVQLVVAVLGVVLGDAALVPAPFGALNAMERLLGLAVPVLALLALVLLRRPPPAPDQPALTATAEAAPPEPEPDPALQPTWRPDAATGAVWLSAGDAASGRPPTTAAPVGDPDEPHPWASGPR